MFKTSFFGAINHAAALEFAQTEGVAGGQTGASRPDVSPAERKSRRNVLAIVLGTLGCIGCLTLLFAGVLLAWFGMRRGKIPALPFLYTPTSTSTLTPTPTSTATPIPWDIDVLDDLSNNNQKWPIIVSEKYDCGIENMYLDRGALFWNINAMQGCFWTRKPDLPPVTDFDVSVDVFDYSPNEADAGITFRGNEAADQYYYYGILASEKKFAVFVFMNRQWTPLINWTDNDHILSGNVNRLRVVAEGSHLTFYVNGTRIAIEDDDEIPSGYVGLGGEIDYSGYVLSVKFDNFELHANTR
jgi:hypothetical protein